MNRKYLVASLISVVLFISACGADVAETYDAAQPVPGVEATLLSSDGEAAAALEVTFSHEAGFYDEPFNLVLSAPAGARIHYTLDGSSPTTTSPRYERPIRISAPRPAASVVAFCYEQVSRVTVYSVNAIAIMGDQTSDVATRNFVVGTDVFTRFSEDTLIFALNSDPFGLYDHYEGIFVEGIDRQNFREEYYQEHGRQPEVGYEMHMENPTSPANFNRRGRESERPVHVQMFDSEGELHISQRAGMRVKGGFSRTSEPQKSIELYARDEYGDRNNFPFAFFADEFTHDGQLIDRYRRIRLRNGGSDRYAGFIRDELGQSLFRQAGHSVTQTHAPTAVFLNGEYHGAAWLKSPRTPNHLRRMFGGETDGFEIVSGGDLHFSRSWWTGEQRATDDIHEVNDLAREGFAGADGQARFEEFSSRICVDELIRYYAMQIYLNNYDWPGNNIEMWRYFPTEEEENDPDLHPFLRDGKWRVFAHDVEAGWGVWDGYDRMAREDTIHDILTGDTTYRWSSGQGSAFLYGILSREDTSAQFANVFVDLMEGAFAADNVIRTLDELVALIEPEHNYAMRMDMLLPGNEWWPSMYGVDESREAIRRFARLRPSYMYDSIRAHMGFDRNDRFRVNLTAGDGGTAMMNLRPVDASATGNYFAGTTINITAIPSPGYTVDHWMVNDARREGYVVAVDGDSAVTVYFRAN